MRKKLAYGLALLSVLLVVSATYTPALATTYQLGVQAGNTADYTAAISSISNVTKGHMSVHNATGTIAGLDFTFMYPNGTVATSSSISVMVDVTSTNGSDIGFIFLIAKNLTHGDSVYPTATLTINETTTMIVAGANRTVNHLSLAGVDNFYWDKATGVIVKMNFFFFAWINLTMTSTNMWSAGGLFGLDTTTLLIIGGVVVLVIIVAAVLLMRRRK